MRALITIILITLTYQLKSQPNAEIYRVTSGTVYKGISDSDSRVYTEGNGSVISWDIKGKKLISYGLNNSENDYIITDTWAANLIKSDGFLVIHMSTIDKDLQKKDFELVKYFKNGQEYYYELIIYYGEYRLKYVLEKQ